MQSFATRSQHQAGVKDKTSSNRHVTYLVHEHVESGLWMSGGETAGGLARAWDGVRSWARNFAGGVPEMLLGKNIVKNG